MDRLIGGALTGVLVAVANGVSVGDGRLFVGVNAEVFSQFVFNTGVWGVQAASSPAGTITVSALILTIPSPTGCAGVGLTALMVGMKRRR